MASNTLTQDDKADMELIANVYDTIGKLLEAGRSHMTGGPGCRPASVAAMLGVIAVSARMAEGHQWPDLEARKLAEARRDKTLQKTIKKASRKTPI